MRISLQDMHLPTLQEIRDIPPVAEPSPSALCWAQVFSLMASLLAAGIGMTTHGMWAAGLAVAGLAVATAIEIANPPRLSRTERALRSVNRRQKLLQFRRLG